MLIEGIKICVSVKLKYAVKSVKWSVTGKHESPIRDLITQSSCSYPWGGGGGGGTPHMKCVGMLVVSLRSVNFGFWSHLGCSGQNAIIFSREGLV